MSPEFSPGTCDFFGEFEEKRKSCKQNTRHSGCVFLKKYFLKKYYKKVLTFFRGRDIIHFVRRNGGIGRRARFRSVWWQHHEGSSPSFCRFLRLSMKCHGKLFCYFIRVCEHSRRLSCPVKICQYTPVLDHVAVSEKIVEETHGSSQGYSFDQLGRKDNRIAKKNKIW